MERSRPNPPLPTAVTHFSSNALPQLHLASVIITAPNMMNCTSVTVLGTAKRALKCTAGSPAADSADCVRLTIATSAPVRQHDTRDANQRRSHSTQRQLQCWLACSGRVASGDHHVRPYSHSISICRQHTAHTASIIRTAQHWTKRTTAAAAVASAATDDPLPSQDCELTWKRQCPGVESLVPAGTLSQMWPWSDQLGLGVQSCCCCLAPQGPQLRNTAHAMYRRLPT